MAHVNINIDRGEKVPALDVTITSYIGDDEVMSAHDAVHLTKAAAIAAENLLIPTITVRDI